MSVSNLFQSNGLNLYCNSMTIATNLIVDGTITSSNFITETIAVPIIYSGDSHTVVETQMFVFNNNNGLKSCYFPSFSDTIPIGGPTAGYYYIIIPTAYLPTALASAQQCITIVGSTNNTGTIFCQPAGAGSQIRIYNGIGQANFPGTAAIPQGLPFGTVINYV